MQYFIIPLIAGLFAGVVAAVCWALFWTVVIPWEEHTVFYTIVFCWRVWRRSPEPARHAVVAS